MAAADLRARLTRRSSTDKVYKNQYSLRAFGGTRHAAAGARAGNGIRSTARARASCRGCLGLRAGCVPGVRGSGSVGPVVRSGRIANPATCSGPREGKPDKAPPAARSLSPQRSFLQIEVVLPKTVGESPACLGGD